MEATQGYAKQIRDESRSAAEILNVYDQWAETYEEEAGKRITAARQEYLLKLISRLLKGRKDVTILDCGAGAGWYGLLFSQEGYKHIDAVDGSEKMLEKAKAKKVYRRIVCAFVGPNKLDFSEGTYDMIFCIGSLYENHIKDDCFPELLRLTKPGGYLVFSVKEKPASKKFENTMQEYHDSKRWIWQERNLVDDYASYMGEDGKLQNDTGIVYVFEKPQGVCGASVQMS